MFRLDFAGWSLALMRRVLYAWVRVRVLPEQVTELELDPARPVVYALHGRHLSNLLLLFEETRRAGLPDPRASFDLGGRRRARSFFFLERRRGIIAPAQARAPSKLMIELVAATLGAPADDVQIVPVSVFWGRAPDKQQSILKALFAETWRAPGFLRQSMAIVLHGRQALLRFAKPFSLAELLAGEQDAARAERKLARILRVHFRRQREVAIGPDLSHRNTEVASLLEAPAVRTAIAQDAATRGFPRAHSWRRARRFALEIAADYSYGVVRALEIFLSWLWTRLYDGIEVRNFDRLLAIAPGQGIVYLPCHRSHIDYLLLSYVVYARGLTPPHIAAGENLNLPVVGAILRRGGAFFLRRSFKGEPLYAAVFDEYLHRMLARGFPIEYFLEGGRSRSGRMLAPKAGLLGMTVRSFLRAHGRPLMLVPVYIGYQKLVEGRSYVEELQGKPKARESLWALLGAWRALRQAYGKVQVNFGEPLSLVAALDAAHADWRAAADLRAPWVRELIDSVSSQMATRINAAAVVTPVNLVALALLSTPRRTADTAALAEQIALLKGLLEALPYSREMVLAVPSPEQALADVARLGFVETLPHALGPLLRVRAETAAELAYFGNNVRHLFALPSLVACLLARNRRLERERLGAAVAGIYAWLRAEFFLRWSEQELPEELARVIAWLAARGLLRERAEGTRLLAAEANSPAFAQLRWLGEIIRPTLERQFLSLVLLQSHGPGQLTKKTLEEKGHLLAQRLSLLYAFNAPEFSDRSAFASFIATLLDHGLLTENADGMLAFDERLDAAAAQAELVLAAEPREAIRRMAGESATR